MIDLLRQFIPAKYWPLILSALPLVGRTYYSIINGGGIRGWWRAIWFGKSVAEKPKEETK